VTRSNSVLNFSEIEQSAADLLQFQYLTWWPWTCVTCCASRWDFRQVWAWSTYPFVTYNVLMLI